jgi:hypothetical protein
VYFDVLAGDDRPREVSPRGFLGDGLDRCAPVGDSSTGLIHSRVDVVDYNRDGLPDLVLGCSRGGVVWFPNCGQAGEPRFPYSQVVHFDDGRPIDVGWGSAPRAVDWDGNGSFDLLVGGERNRLLWCRNRGSPGQPRWHYEGFVHTDDGQALSLPTTPVPEGPDVFKLDYYPVVETVDWDGDDDLDLLAGGYITGRIYWYENVGAGVAGPRLKLRGPLYLLVRAIVYRVGLRPRGVRAY